MNDLALQRLSVPASAIESIRLQRTDGVISLVYATTEVDEESVEPYLTILTETGVNGVPSARIFEVPRLLPATCSWDLERAPDGTRALLFDPHLGGTREVRRITPTPDFAAIAAHPERLLINLLYTTQSFSKPRVARGFDAVTTIVDDKQLVAFLPDDARYHPLVDAIDGLIVRAAGELRVVAAAPRNAPYRADSLAPGTLRLHALDETLQTTPLPFAPEETVYGVDADANERLLAIAAITVDALRVWIGDAGGNMHVTIAVPGFFTSPTLLLDGDTLHVAALEDGAVVYGWRKV